MPRTDGKKIVGVAVAGIVGMVGFAQIYLPYIADRDKIRGLFEEDDIPAGARLEIESILKKEREQAAKEEAQKMPVIEEKQPVAAGSMWKNLRGGGK
eukprot:scaffold421144_cov55-Attheya_sp.AAC.1